MTDLAAFPELLAAYFEIGVDELPSKSVIDPIGSIRIDTDILLDQLRGPSFLLTGLVYDVATGVIDVVVPPTQLRTD